MCGIAGIISADNQISNTKILYSMLNALLHRGPDGEGVYHNSNVSIGMRRLSIIDLENGRQPFFNEKRNIVVLGNGEIYNYIELKKQLNKKHQFVSKSDVEIVVHLYEEKGISCIDDLVGMFAIVIYDIKAKKLFIIRDRYGEKPLYFSQIGKNTLCFSSELKSLLKVPKINKLLDIGSCYDYFIYNYIPEPDTAFKNIYKLPSSHVMVVNIKNKITYQLNKYWNFDAIPINKKVFTTSDLKNKLKEACRISLRSDVPVGISLSGGIDSSAILAFSAKQSKSNLIAFSIGYSNKSKNDESVQAQRLCKKLNVKYVRKEISSDDLIIAFPEVIYWGDDPIADLAAFSIYSVSKVAREYNVPVLLSGLGGDELFWGYPWVNNYIIKNKVSLPIMHYNTFDGQVSFNRALSFRKKYFIQKKYDKEKKGRIVDDEISLVMATVEDIREKWLISNCNTLNDRMGMAFSVETRSPFLDINLSKMVLGSYNNIMSYKMSPKYYLKQALNKIVPDNTLNRPKKGFSPPAYFWFKKTIQSYIYLLQNGFIAENKLLTNRKINLIIHTWYLQPFFWFEIYKLIVLEIWGREYVWGVDYQKIIAKRSIPKGV